MGWTPRFMMYQKLLKSNYAVWAANYAVSPANYAVSFFTFFWFVFLKPWTNSKHIQLYSVRSLPPFPHTNLNGGNKMLPFLRNPKVFGIFDITHHFLKHCFRASAPRCRRHKRWQRSAGVNLRSQGNRKAWLTSKHFWEAMLWWMKLPQILLLQFVAWLKQTKQRNGFTPNGLKIAQRRQLPCMPVSQTQ